MLQRNTGLGKGGRRVKRGTAAVEFGLAVPVLAAILTAIVEIGFSAYQAMQVSYAAEAGVAYAAKKGWDSAGITSAVAAATDLSGMSATPTQYCACPSATGLAAATCGSTCGSGFQAGQYIQVGVSLTRKTLIGATSFGLPSTLSAQAILRQN